MIEQLHYAFGQPKSTASIKSTPEDFFVSEILGYPLDGEGEHLYVHIEKTLLNTEEMVKILSKTLQVSPGCISYAGLKDKFAKTQQWFSLHLPGEPNPNLNELHSENVTVLNAQRHTKKLKKGALLANQFEIKIKNSRLDVDDINTRVEQVQQKGVPNYFGGQRFGHAGNNIDKSRTMLLEGKKVKNRHLKGLYFSTARSFLFNHILSYRVFHGVWNQAIEGDLLMLSGTNSFFQADEALEKLNQRIRDRDISPALPLWGKGDEKALNEALGMQQRALEPFNDWCRALEVHDLRKAYRPSILYPQSFSFDDLTFKFILPKGAYATILLRELIQF